MDRESKIFLCFLVFMILIIVPICYFAIQNLSKRTDDCIDKNGIMVRTVDGYRCIDAKVL